MTTSWIYSGLSVGLGFSLAQLAGVWTFVAILWLLVVLWLVRLQRALPETELVPTTP